MIFHPLFLIFFTQSYKQNTGIKSCQFESRAANYEDFFADFGGLFYLAIVLSIVFLLAAVLIIYYKQISEGYEDQARFDIMQKVGMTKRNSKKHQLTAFDCLFPASCRCRYSFDLCLSDD